MILIFSYLGGIKLSIIEHLLNGIERFFMITGKWLVTERNDLSLLPFSFSTIFVYVYSRLFSFCYWYKSYTKSL